MEHASTVDVGTRKRRHRGINEDSIATAVFENHHRQSSRPVGVFVLCDGVGGEASGDVASFLATTAIRRSLVDAILGPGTDVPEQFEIDALDGQSSDADEVLTEPWIQARIQEAIDAAHQRIQQYAEAIDGRPATTAVVAVAVDGRLSYGWVGDSRAYVINIQHGRIQQLTRDHAVTNELLDRGEIDDDVFARVHEDTTAITNALGGSPYGSPQVDVEFGSVDLYEDDVVLLTSDGLIDAYPDIGPLRDRYRQASDKAAAREELLEVLVTDDEIFHTILDAPDLRTGVERLIDLANERGGKDNLSILLARDPALDPTPETLPTRGVGGESTPTRSGDAPSSEANLEATSSLVDRNTMIEPAGDESPADSPSESAETPEPDAEAEADADQTDQIDDGSEEAEGDEGEPTAALAIEGQENVFEIAPGFTIGRGAVEGGDNPDIGLVVSEEANIETHHARFDCDDEGNWLVRDVSTSGTFVLAGEEWHYLLSEEGIKKSQERGFDPEADPEAKPDESAQLRDGMAITLHHPQDPRAIRLRFFESLDAAREGLPTIDDGDFFRRGRS